MTLNYEKYTLKKNVAITSAEILNFLGIENRVSFLGKSKTFWGFFRVIVQQLVE